VSRDPLFADLAFWDSQSAAGDADPGIAQMQALNIYAPGGNNFISRYDSHGLLTASGPSILRGSREHLSAVAFHIVCPKCTQFKFGHLDYSGVVPALKLAGYNASKVDADAGKDVWKSGLGGEVYGVPIYTPNPRNVNCDGGEVDVYGWMKSRYAASADAYWPVGLSYPGYKQASAAGAAAYGATILIYTCEPCVSGAAN
jgi:hypothetical protein